MSMQLRGTGYLKRGVKYEEISTFWHGHRNRCFIFCVKCDENKRALFLKSYFYCLNIYSYNQQNPKIERKNKKRNVGRNFEKNDDYWQNDVMMDE